MEDMTLRFHYEQFACAVEQQAECWDLNDSGRQQESLAGHPIDVVVQGLTCLRDESAGPSSSVGSSECLADPMDEVTS